MADIREFLISSQKRTAFGRMQERYNSAMIKGGKKLWQGVLEVAASGFGKGVLITGLAVLAITAMVTGYDAYAYNYPFAQGFAAGLGKGIDFMVHSFGLLTLAIGGTLGAVNEVHKKHNKVTADIAQAEAKNFELVRQIQADGVNLAPAVESSKPWEQSLESDFAAREKQRRTQIQQTGNRTIH